jgi:hypothetical protein
MPRAIMTCDEIAGLSMIRTTRSVPTRAPRALGRERMSARGAQAQKMATSGRRVAARREAVAVKRRECK